MRKQISNNKILNGLYQYRLIIFAVFFLIVIPIFIVSFLYLGTYYEHKTVKFNSEVSSSKFMNAKLATVNDRPQYSLDLGDFTFYVNFTDITLPTEQENTDEDDNVTITLVNGRYHFSTYISNKKSNVSNVSANFALQTQWMDTLSTTSKELSSTSSTFTISYNHKLPKYPLWFVKVSRPDLYAHLSYSVGGIQRDVFIKMNLQNALVSIK
ncbi:MAG: hypothetical protein GX312_05395 [Candidatus Phytoplasma sp.]|nr:hypothetical protein [Phytoplasma sp.]